ncbi:uncharacterized protein LOC117792470 [Drosophila innubila]|uniref:uncharacterized protein LOC117792470 n=1 Tax=Drosophila innubila TaxID=198719 RepID=UPI00148E4AAE|nr:uncharacterized protein LOC117792470 [Drosophila innubila]
MDPPLVMVTSIDTNGTPSLIWLPPTSSASTSPKRFAGVRIVAFHYFDHHYKKLKKWTDLIEKLALEYVGRIKFEAHDIKTVKTFHSSLSSDDFGSFRADVPPQLFGVDSDGCIYTMHMLFSYKYIKDFCEKLLKGKMFEAVVLNPIQDIDFPPQNYYQLQAQNNKDLFVMFYDPSTYYWFLQIGKLRKLAKLLANEDVNVVIVNRGHNYLGVDFDKWSELSSFHGVTKYATKRSNGWISNQSEPHDSTRGYLRYIAQHRNPELQDYDRKGERRYPEEALEDIQHIYET